MGVSSSKCRMPRGLVFGSGIAFRFPFFPSCREGRMKTSRCYSYYHRWWKTAPCVALEKWRKRRDKVQRTISQTISRLRVCTVSNRHATVLCCAHSFLSYNRLHHHHHQHHQLHYSNFALKRSFRDPVSLFARVLSCARSITEMGMGMVWAMDRLIRLRGHIKGADYTCKRLVLAGRT